MAAAKASNIVIHRIVSFSNHRCWSVMMFNLPSCLMASYAPVSFSIWKWLRLACTLRDQLHLLSWKQALAGHVSSLLEQCPEKVMPSIIFAVLKTSQLSYLWVIWLDWCKRLALCVSLVSQGVFHFLLAYGKYSIDCTWSDVILDMEVTLTACSWSVVNISFFHNFLLDT